MTNTDMAGDREPRYFWRRGFAFLLDALVGQLAAALLFALIHGVTGISLGQGFTAYQTQCTDAPAGHPQIARVDALWPLPAGAERQNVVCNHTVNGEASQTFVTRVIRKDGATTYTKEVAYPIDKDGKALPTEYALDLTPFVIVVFFIILAANGRRTPGKAALSLRIRTADGGGPGWRDATQREVLKLLPLVLFGVLTLWMVVAPPVALTDSEASIISMRDGTLLTSPWILILFGWGAAACVWWFGPFIVWRGRTWYDALAGTKLVRTDPPGASARRRP